MFNGPFKRLIDGEYAKSHTGIDRGYSHEGLLIHRDFQTLGNSDFSPLYFIRINVFTILQVDNSGLLYLFFREEKPNSLHNRV